MIFGEQLRLAREARGWSRFRLSLVIKERFKHERLSESAIWLLEGGRSKRPRNTTLSMLQQVFPELQGIQPTPEQIESDTQERPQRVSVYFIQAGTLPIVKIGSTNSRVDLRLNHLQVGSWEPLKLIGVIENSKPELEAELHKRFSDNRIRGEWFALDDRLARYIKLWAEIN